MSSTPQAVSLTEYVRARDKWNADQPMYAAELIVLTGHSRRTVFRCLEDAPCHNAPRPGERPRRGAMFLPSAVAPFLYNGQPHRPFGPVPEESDALAQEAS